MQMKKENFNFKRKNRKLKSSDWLGRCLEDRTVMEMLQYEQPDTSLSNGCLLNFRFLSCIFLKRNERFLLFFDYFFDNFSRAQVAFIFLLKFQHFSFLLFLSDLSNM